MKFRWLALLFFPLVAQADDGKSDVVDWAMSYQPPAHECKAPKLRRSKNVGEQIERYERKANRFARCLRAHQQDLLADRQRLLDSAAHGLTQAQAEAVLGNIKTLQTTLEKLAAELQLNVPVSEIDHINHVEHRESH